MIQELQIQDLEHLVPLFDQYMVFYGQPSNPTKYEAYLHERLSNGEATVFIAFDSNREALGFVLNYHSFSSVSLGKIVVLNDLFVAASARGKGHGRKLIERTFEYAKAYGAVRVDLGTAKTNTTAQALYESIGFIKDTKFFAYSYPL